MMILLEKILRNITTVTDITDIIYLINLVIKEEKLTSIELEHLFNMLVILYDEFPQSP
jgi:hypothetical protein